MALKIGVNGKVYFLSTGSRATWHATVTNGRHVGAAPSNLTEIKIVKDVEVDQSKEKADVSTRLSNYKATKGTQIGVSVELPMIYDPADAGCAALEKAFFTDALIAVALLDGDKGTAGTQGFWADFEVTDMKKSEKLNDAQLVTYTIEPGYSAVPPENIKVA
jgi:hypothetical protein